MNDLELAAYLDRRLKAGDRERIEAHLASCHDCRDELAQSYRLIQRARRPRRLVALGLVASAAVVMLLVFPGRRRNPSGDAVVRQGDAAPAIVALAPLGESPRAGLRFIWGQAPGASTYQLTISRQDGGILWSAVSGDTAVVLPDTVTLIPGEHYLWAADALLTDGQTRSTGLREFVATP